MIRSIRSMMCVIWMTILSFFEKSIYFLFFIMRCIHFYLWIEENELALTVVDARNDNVNCRTASLWSSRGALAVIMPCQSLPSKRYSKISGHGETGWLLYCWWLKFTNANWINNRVVTTPRLNIVCARICVFSNATKRLLLFKHANFEWNSTYSLICMSIHVKRKQRFFLFSGTSSLFAGLPFYHRLIYITLYYSAWYYYWLIIIY